MIDFNIDKARATRERYGRLLKSEGSQYSEVTSYYNSTKSKLAEKIRSVKRDISFAETERADAEETLRHNKEVEAEVRARIEKLKSRIASAEKEKSKKEAARSRAESALSAVRSMSDSGSSGGGLESMLESKISSLSSDIYDLEKEISEKQKELAALEKKLAAIEKANQALEKIIPAIEKDIKRLAALEKYLTSLVSKMKAAKEAYDAKYNAAKHGMEILLERSGRAIEAGSKAISYLASAGGGHSKSVRVDSYSTISRISMDIDSAASKLSATIFDLEMASDKFRSRIKDRITDDVRKIVTVDKDICKETSGAWQEKARNLKNAAYELKWYVETKM